MVPTVLIMAVAIAGGGDGNGKGSTLIQGTSLNHEIIMDGREMLSPPLHLAFFLGKMELEQYDECCDKKKSQQEGYFG